MLDNGFSYADLMDAEASSFLGASTPERSKLFGSHGQRPWFHEVMKESYGKDLEPLFRGGIDAELIREQWDPLVRIASSLRQRTAPAHVVVQRLAGSSPSDRLSRALTALGRAVKTIYILRYLHEGDVRRRVQFQLNRGESRHDLARWLLFANQGSSARVTTRRS